MDKEKLISLDDGRAFEVFGSARGPYLTRIEDTLDAVL